MAVFIIVVTIWCCLFTIVGSFQYVQQQRTMQRLFAAKGFGKVDSSTPEGQSNGRLIDTLTPSRPGTHRPIVGTYSRILQSRCETFEKMQNNVKMKPFSFYDIYARCKGDEVCWFIGKVSHYPDINHNSAFAAIEVLLLEYARSLRPKELGSFSSVNKELELWYALGNTEMAVAQNKINLTRLVIDKDITPAPYHLIGYQPEIYTNGETGFRARRDAQGFPLEAAFDVQLQDSVPVTDAKPVDITNKISS